MVPDSDRVLSSLFDKTSRWYERAKAALVGDLPCSKGCSACCVGLFPVTLLDRLEIRRGLRSLPHEDRRMIELKAAGHICLIETSTPQLLRNRFIDLWPDHDTDTVVERYRELPCPALDSHGSCRIYQFRPLACRSMGIPSEGDGIGHGACALQTSIPVIRLSQVLRDEEGRLAGEEAEHLARLRNQSRTEGEELLLPYAFVPELDEEPTAGAA